MKYPERLNSAASVRQFPGAVNQARFTTLRPGRQTGLACRRNATPALTPPETGHETAFLHVLAEEPGFVQRFFADCSQDGEIEAILLLGSCSSCGIKMASCGRV
jgi:hypothetical protein